MAAPERMMVSNPSADSSDALATDDASADRVVDLLEALRRGRKPQQSTHDIQSILRANYSQLAADVTIWTGSGSLFPTGVSVGLMNDPFHPSYFGDVTVFEVEGLSTRGLLEELNPTTLTPNEPLLHAVSQATDEQKEQIWRVLGVSETVTIRRRGVDARPQSVSSDWLDEALNVHANPTPISLEDWYTDESE